MTDIFDMLNNLRARLDALIGQDMAETTNDWRQLRTEIDALCTQLERGDPATARAALPHLAEMISLAEQAMP